MSTQIGQKTKTMKDLVAKFDIGSELGTGAFSEVRKATEKATGKQVAIKIIDRVKCKGKEGMIQSEIDILTKVQHRNIISLYEMYESDAKIFLVMQLVSGGELFDRIVARGHYTEADAARIVYPILLAVDYLHEMGIAHRDLKPENLLFSDPSDNAHIMISDFGLSKIFDDVEMMKTACGTPGYVAPEVLKRQGYGKEVDIWSIGVITYILLCGYPPFYDENDIELFGQIMRGEYEFDSPYWDSISREAKDFIRKMLVVNPRHRITVKGSLRHPFITNNNVIDEADIEAARNPRPQAAAGEADGAEAAAAPSATGASATPAAAPATAAAAAAPAGDAKARQKKEEIKAKKEQLAKTDSEKSNLAPTFQSNMQKFSPKKLMVRVLQGNRNNA